MRAIVLVLVSFGFFIQNVYAFNLDSLENKNEVSRIVWEKGLFFDKLTNGWEILDSVDNENGNRILSVKKAVQLFGYSCSVYLENDKDFFPVIEVVCG